MDELRLRIPEKLRAGSSKSIAWDDLAVHQPGVVAQAASRRPAAEIDPDQRQQQMLGQPRRAISGGPECGAKRATTVVVKIRLQASGG